MMFLITMMEKYSKVSVCSLLGGGQVFKFPSIFFTCHFLQSDDNGGNELHCKKVLILSTRLHHCFLLQ